MTTQPTKHIIDEMLVDFGFYMNPDLLKKEYQGLLDISKVNMKHLEKYNELLSSINFAWQKILRYEVYFQEFYSNSGKIEKYEELNHHIHAYLQDVDTFKNKIEILFGDLKNDLKQVATNKKEISEFLQAGVDKTRETFEEILKHRKQHVHRGMRFTDGDLLKVESAHQAIEILSNPVVDAWVNQEYKPVAIAKLEKNKEESFDVAKARWISTAQKNNVQITGFLNSILTILHPNLYQFLEIRATKELLKTEGTK